ncbi:MAG: diguanylate cyclase [Ktedonobacteraceae bacterium]|nr:diguanylate cyclase [Ktedonobacteraceae bacterium]
MPLWMGAGLLDWYHHRYTNIEKTAGTHESMIHSLMMTEAGLPIMAGLFLEVNALTLALMIVAFFAHEATAFWDVAYAEGLREVTPNEQHTHSFLEVIPFMAVSVMICLHWDQFCALMGTGDEPPRFELRPKRYPLSRRYVNAILTAVVATVALPYAEEFWRCYRVDRTLAAHQARTQ